MAHISTGPRRLHPRPRSAPSPLTGPLLLLVGAGLLAAAYVGYVLWPRWPGNPVSLDAPALPVTVAGVMFNIEPAAIRMPVQRKAGTQERVDLAYLWPSLTPPDPAVKPTVAAPADPNERLFVTISGANGVLPPLERLQTIYPRYLGVAGAPDRSGLTVRPFRDGTVYQGEDLIYDGEAPAHFLARCSRHGVGNGGMCLYERRIGEADITLRFPRDWLSDWQGVAKAVDRLLARLHPPQN